VLELELRQMLRQLLKQMLRLRLRLVQIEEQVFLGG
jgi:hypothetical protein